MTKGCKNEIKYANDSGGTKKEKATNTGFRTTQQ